MKDYLALLDSKQLKPYRVTTCHDGDIIYEFYRVDSKEEIRFAGRRDVKTELAMIVAAKDGKTFTLFYYPTDKSSIQIIEKISIDKLAGAIEDLKQAGF